MELPSSSSSVAAALGFRELGSDGRSVGFQGVQRGPRHLYKAERRRLGVRATAHGAENSPRPDSADSTPNTGKKKAPMGGARMAEREGGGEWGASWAGEGELGRRWDFWAAGKGKNKKMEKGEMGRLS